MSIITHYYVDTPLDLKGRGITLLDVRPVGPADPVCMSLEAKGLHFGGKRLHEPVLLIWKRCRGANVGNFGVDRRSWCP